MIVAAMQMTPTTADVSANLDRIGAGARAAAALGATLLVTPELSATGYAIGVDPAEAARFAEDADGTIATTLSAIAADTGVAVVAGFPERAGDRVFNSAVLARPDGTREVYRKCHLFGPEERAAYVPSSSAPAVFDLDGIRAGMVICYDVEFPEMVQGLAAAGADLVIVPTALPRSEASARIADMVVPTRALENHVFVMYADLCGTERDLSYAGRSVIAAPDGEIVAQAGSGETILVAELNIDGYSAIRAETPYAEDRRPDVYAGFGRPTRPASRSVESVG